MGLPFEPQSITEQQDRYSAAVELVIDRFRNPEYVISSTRKHVFDSLEGIRLIVSREVNDLGVYLHFSASMEPGFHYHNQYMSGLLSKEAACRLFIARFRDISRDYRKAKFLGFSEVKGVPHWAIKEKGL